MAEPSDGNRNSLRSIFCSVPSRPSANILLTRNTMPRRDIVAMSSWLSLGIRYPSQRGVGLDPANWHGDAQCWHRHDSEQVLRVVSANMQPSAQARAVASNGVFELWIDAPSPTVAMVGGDEHGGEVQAPTRVVLSGSTRIWRQQAGLRPTSTQVARNQRARRKVAIS